MDLEKAKKEMRKQMQEFGADSTSFKFRDKKNEETLIITLHDYIDEE